MNHDQLAHSHQVIKVAIPKGFNMQFKHSWWLARVAWAIHAGFAVVAWFNLPSRIPTHFNAAGTADAWSQKSILSWFTILATSFFLQLMIQVLMSPIAKDAWNMPEKERFLKLTPEQQQPVINHMRAFGGICALGLTLTMFALHIGMYLAAQGITRGLPWYIHLGMYLPIAGILLAIIPWSKAVKQSILETSAS